MIIGVPQEIKDHETRVGIVPGGVALLREDGHQVLVQSGAGEGSRIEDAEFIAAGAEMVASAADVWRRADVVVKVKEPQAAETAYFRNGLTLFTYLHLAPLPDLTSQMLASGMTAIAYETVLETNGTLPLLTPMSEVAGRLATQIGAFYLEAPNGGRGVLLGGVPGVAPGEVVILGGGVAGTHAARIAYGMGARVTILDIDLNRLRELDDLFDSQIVTLTSNPVTVANSLRNADVVIGCVLIPGATAPKIVKREMVRDMKKGAVFVDVAVDQGGCSETTRATTHSDPIYFVDDVLHYCVSNIPAAVPHTSTYALTNATLPYLRMIARWGLEGACQRSEALCHGVNIYRGRVTHEGVAASQERALENLRHLLAA